jgi:hypothetical protein
MLLTLGLVAYLQQREALLYPFRFTQAWGGWRQLRRRTGTPCYLKKTIPQQKQPPRQLGPRRAAAAGFRVAVHRPIRAAR